MKLPAPWSGTSAIAAWMRQIRSYVQSETFLGGRGFRKVPTPTGWYLEAIDTPGGGSKIQTAATVSLFCITTLGNDDYFTAKKISNVRFLNGKWVGDVTGQDYQIAKPEPQRKTIANENLDGVVITYTAPPSLSPAPTPDGYTDNNRVANDGSGTESQVCFPRYRSMAGLALTSPIPMTSQCVVVACQPDNGTGVAVAGTQLTWLEISPARVWAKRFN